MNDIQAWAIGLGVIVGVSVFARFMPKNKLIAFAQKTCEPAGRALSKILMLRLGKKAAESIEEGIFSTIAAALYAGIDSFMKGLLYDNVNYNQSNNKQTGGNDGNT